MTNKTILRVAAIVSGVSGIIILTGVIYPIVSYNSTYSKKFELISPVTNSKYFHCCGGITRALTINLLGSPGSPGGTQVTRVTKESEESWSST